MSAQYRPYRDEESVDGLETTSWTDNEPGSIQIYEKTTEELPFAASKKTIWIQLALYTLAGSLGFILGYFGHFHGSELVTSPNENAHVSSASHYSEIFEDSTIKDEIMRQINEANIRATIEKFQNVKRIPGSVGDREFAAYVERTFIDLGMDPVSTYNYTFETMMPKQSSIVSILDKGNKTIYSTKAEGDSKNRLSSAMILDEATPFLPLSQAEETIITTNQLLYLNKGLKDDYAILSSLGVSTNETEGKIFVIRQTFYQAHDVVINAQESGAQAILLFPDPDTFGFTSPFPPSVQLPNDAARSHPLAWGNYGDLASLNISMPNSVDVNKLSIERDSKVHIPVILISYNTAKSLLVGLSGAQAPKDWNCFDFTLHLGPGYREENGIDGRSSIKLELFNEETTINATTVTGIIAGLVEPDRYVVVGSHRDSLTSGVLDSVSGTAVMLELARVYTNLVKTGWRPKRTIVFNSFGAESFNLIGSSNWIEAHQRLIQARAVTYINCDIVVSGNNSLTVSASPLLHQTIYNATKQVPDPFTNRISTYQSWMNYHAYSRSDEMNENRLTDFGELGKIIFGDKNTSNAARESGGDTKDTLSIQSNTEADKLGYQGDQILRDYMKSATVLTRPLIRRLDTQSVYSPFFLYAGIPVVDVRYTGFKSADPKSRLVEDTLPLIGTKYDNMAALNLLDPHMKYHLAIARILGETLRDLSDSMFLPFNLLDYAVTLADSYGHLTTNFENRFQESNIDLGVLKRVIHDFTVAAARFHRRQGQVDLRDSLQVRRFNDQMMLLERAFIDSTNNYWEKKHIILASHDGQEQKGGFPSLVDWIALLEGESLNASSFSLFVEVLKVHYKIVVYTISNAIKIIEDVHII